MGYSHNELSVFIPPSKIHKTAGTWTPTIASNLTSDVRSAAAAAFTLIIPIVPPFQSDFYRMGAKLNSIEVFWKNATADLSAFAATLNKIALPANTVAAAGAAVTAVTIDTGHDMEAECLTQASHTMTVTLDTPPWVDKDEYYVLSIVITGASGSVFSLFGARANFTLRT